MSVLFIFITPHWVPSPPRVVAHTPSIQRGWLYLNLFLVTASNRPLPSSIVPPRRSKWMEPANEETGLVPRPSSPSQSSASNPRPDSPTAAASSSDGVSASNGSFLPQARNNSPHGSPKDRPVSGIVPPYWTHHRNVSRASQSSLDRFPAITLEDHTEDPNSETSRGLWARSVSVNDHVVVQGKTGIGSYVVWNCTIQTLEVQRSLAPT